MKITTRHFSALVFLLLFVGEANTGIAQEIHPTDRPGVSGMLQKVTPSVVNIAVTGKAAPTNPLLQDPRLQQFFGAPDQQEAQPTMSVGSGVIIDADKGYVLTNNHVVQDADDIEITLQDKRRLKAKLLGTDAGTDIALLQVDAKGLTAIKMSDSDTLNVGDFVVAIGNPFGIGQTVTTGIVSALDRTGISNGEGYEDFIQTDASINPGNSGGALIDYNGELIGINAAIIAPSGGNVGIGFAVPVNMARAVITQLVEFGEVSRGLLGVQIVDLTPDIVDALKLDIKDGAVVSSVVPDSPAAKAGIEAGDIIVGVNKQKVDGAADLRNTVGLIRSGTKIDIELLHDAKRKTITAELGSAGGATVADSQGANDSVLEGAQLGTLSRNDGAYNGLGGVMVTNVEQGSRAWNNGLRPNDVITAVNRQVVTAPADVTKILEASKGTIALNVMREGQNLFLILR